MSVKILKTSNFRFKSWDPKMKKVIPNEIKYIAQGHQQGLDSEFKSRSLAFSLCLEPRWYLPIWLHDIMGVCNLELVTNFAQRMVWWILLWIIQGIDLHYFTVCLASRIFFVPSVKSLSLLSFIFLPQVHSFITYPFLFEGLSFPPFGCVGSSFPPVSWKRCGIASYSWFFHVTG